MNRPFTKLLCTLLVLVLLLAPAAALAEDEATSVSIDIGNGPLSFVTVPASGLNTDDLYLNTIPFDPQLSPKGYIILYTADLAAAASATKAVGVYNVMNPGDPFVVDRKLKIQGGRGIEVGRINDSSLALPGKEIADQILTEKLHIGVDARNEYVPDLLRSLTSMSKILTKAKRDATHIPNTFSSIPKDFNATEQTFRANLRALYLWLYDIRAAIAKGDFPAELLSNKEIMEVLRIFRAILSEIGVNLNDLAFWDRDEAWTAWAAANDKMGREDVFALKGQSFELSDATGKSLQLKVDNVWRTPIEPWPDDTQLEVVSDDIIPGDGTENASGALSLIAGEDYLQDGIDGTACAPRFFILDGPLGAVYTWWTDAALPDGLELYADSDDSSKAYITGTPLETDEDGTDVTVNASATVDGKDYSGSLGFLLIIPEAPDVDEPPVDEPPVDEAPEEQQCVEP